MPTRWTAAMEAAAYAARKLARKCRCGAGLQETDVVRCIECFEARRKKAIRRNGTKRGRKLNAAAARRLRNRRRAKDLCSCCRAPAAPGRTMCDRHLAEHCVEQARYLDRLEQAHA